MTITSALALPANALTAFAFFIQRGLTPAQSAGLVGNFMQESGMDPNSTKPSEGAVGIANWEGGRRTALNSYAASAGAPANSLTTQLWFAWNELNTSEQAALNALKATTTPGMAATVVANDYERCGGCNTPTRIDYANAVFQGGTGNAPPVGSTVAANLTAATSSDDCQIKIPIPGASIGPLSAGGGSFCIWHTGWSRALLGGASIVAGGVLVITGVVLLTGKTVTPAGQITSMLSNIGKESPSKFNLKKRINSGEVKFPGRLAEPTTTAPRVHPPRRRMTVPVRKALNKSIIEARTRDI